MPTAFWALSIKDTLKTLDATAKGLDDKTVKARIKTYGPNTIPEKTRLARTAIAFNQFKSPLISVLFVAALVSLFLKEWVDAGFIFAAVGINTLMGYWQENKAETALEHLKSYIRMRVRVRRNNQELELDAENLVPGDIITLTQGDRVPADARIILTNRCLVDESILTGESLPIEKNATTLPKDTQLAERRCFLHSGTLIVDGFVEAVVTLTGKNTEFGKLAELTAKHVSEKTPLQKAVTHFAFWTGGLIGLFTLVLFVSGLFAGYALKDMFLIAVAIGISAVPEGLPVTLTVILAVGVERLAKRKGVVRKLLAAETLGSTSLILTDKTGTLTLAQMNLTSILPYRATDAEAEKNLLALALNNTDVLVENHSAQPDKWRISGSPEEAAIVRAAGKLLLPIKTADRKITITDRIPFSSERKYSMVSIKPANEEEMTIAMGAPEIIIGFTALSAAEKKLLLYEVDKMAATGERVLALATGSSTSIANANFEFRGLLSFRDPIRDGIKDAINKIKQAGVKTIIVTGDHIGTAKYVAHELGLFAEGGRIISGATLEKMRPKDMVAQLSNVAVFARVSPEQKVRILEFYKQRGEIVAVTGDGVNDGPVLKAASIGVAVGSGSEVAKSASDLVLLDDNFETLVKAIEEGRRILHNIRKVIVYLMSDAMDELFLIGGALLVGLPLPLNALQILFVNFFSDSFPAVAFAFESESGTYQNKRTAARSKIIDPEMRTLILLVGGLGSLINFVSYTLLLRLGYPENLVRTFIFATFALYSLIVAFSLRSLEKTIFQYKFYSNRYLTGGVIIGIILVAFAIYTPLLQSILKTTPLPWTWVAGVLLIAFINLAAVEVTKWLYAKKSRPSQSVGV